MAYARISATFAVAVIGLFLLSGEALAQATRTWVSGVGDDANPCSRTAPCKTFAGAISKTAAGGEINALDPGGYGAVTITKSMTILSEANEAGVLVSGTNGIIVNAGASDVVVLRGLDIEGLGTGLNGVRFLAGAALTVDNCQIRNFSGSPGSGISFEPAGTASLFVTNSNISHNGIGVAGSGIRIAPTGSGNAQVTIAGNNINDNVNGIFADSNSTTGTITMAVSGGSLSGNEGNGLALRATTGASNQAMVDGTTVANNGTGATGAGLRVTGASAVLRISNANLTGNSVGLVSVSGGSLLSYGSNHVDGNSSDGAPTGTIAPK